jgi:thiol-disulfide isomerase/thioredoxin
MIGVFNGLVPYLATICFMVGSFIPSPNSGYESGLVQANKNNRVNTRTIIKRIFKNPKTQTVVKEDFTPDLIKNSGFKDSNYLVMVSANWCPSCVQMYPEIEKLRKQGYIVYVFDITKEEFKTFAARDKYNASRLPTFIVYDKGKQTHRTIGTTKHEWFTSHLKTFSEQKASEKPVSPPVNPYNIL